MNGPSEVSAARPATITNERQLINYEERAPTAGRRRRRRHLPAAALIIATTLAIISWRLAGALGAGAAADAKPALMFDLNQVPEDEHEEAAAPPPEDQFAARRRMWQTEMDLEQLERPAEQVEEPKTSQTKRSEGAKTTGGHQGPEESSGRLIGRQLGGWLAAGARQVAAASLKLPDYFDFGHFRRKFKRQYASTAELLARQAIYLRECLQVFKWRLGYRRGQVAYLRDVNHFSDRTREEFQQVFMVASAREFEEAAATRAGGGAAVGRLREAARERQRLAQLSGRRLAEAASSVETRSRASPAELAAAELGGGATELEDVLQEQAASLQAEALHEIRQLLAGARTELEAAHLLDELADLEPEQASKMAALETADEPDELDQLGQLGRESAPPGPELWPGRRGAEAAPAPGHHRAWLEARVPPGRLGLDWSRHPCFFEVYQQEASCGQCYVLAATALAELYKCSELGPGEPMRRRKFSKDYVLHCAGAVTPEVMGCRGGSPLATLRFISSAGLFTVREWRERSRALYDSMPWLLDDLRNQDESALCPLRHSDQPHQLWGPNRVQLNPRRLGQGYQPHSWLEALQWGPLLVTLQMPAEGVQSYAGGLHDGRTCLGSGLWHVMLLVGYGRSPQGEPYWRFRNTFGPDWGDQGHFHLSMESAPADCFQEAVHVLREPLAAAD